MQREDQEITDLDQIREILKKGIICRLAVSVDDVPYIIPLNYGVEFADPWILYFHCAPSGRKLEMIGKNNHVCFEIEVDTKIVQGKQACDWSMQYKSLIGYGRIEILHNEVFKQHGLDIIMQHYAGEGDFEYKPNHLKRTLILKLTVESLSGKSHSA